VQAYQRKLDKVVDEMIARERQETAARSQAVTIVVTLFISAFFVALAKPLIIEEFSLSGRIALIGLSLIGARYLVKNLATALSRYTYSVPSRLTSVFQHDPVTDKRISRKAALVFLVCGYIVSLGLGYLISKLAAGPDLAPGTVLGIILYPPIAVLIIGSFRSIGSFLDRS
jgi:4-hydroxybenzoate polyprenyltransferase